MNNRIEEILTFWFGDLTDQTPMDGKHPQMKRWWQKNPDTDEFIRKNFEEDILKASSLKYTQWQVSARGLLALIILLDQFSRNIFRDSPKAFENDPQALKFSLKAIREGKDQELNFFERVFLYMPLMHSEDLHIQNESIHCFEKLKQDASDKNHPSLSSFENNVQFAKKHYDIIKKFGRYPHRNKFLNRESTPEEIEFLKQPGSSF